VTRRESPRDLRILRKCRGRNCPAVIQTFIDDLIAAQEEADEEDVLPLKASHYGCCRGSSKIKTRHGRVFSVAWLG
jgi:hypothetical protein